MPRDRRANIGSGIWSEPSMRLLTRRQRDAYLLAMTQPDVSRCGVLAYRLRYWSTLTIDGTEDELAVDYADLHRSRHVVVDTSDEQLFLRTYVKHDGLLSQPLVVVSMIRDYYKITSPTIKTAFLAELRRLWDDPEIDDRGHQGLELCVGAKPVDLGIKNADKVTTAVGAGLLGPFIEAIRKGHVDPFLAKGLPKGLTEGQLEGLTEGQPTPRSTAPASVTATATAPATAPVANELAHPDDPTGTLLVEHAQAYTTPPPPSALTPVRNAVARLVAEGTPPDQIRAGLARMRDRRLTATLLPQLVAECIPSRTPSTTDARVTTGLELAARFEERP